MGKFELFKGKDLQWYFRFLASNGREIFRSTDGYVNRADAVNGINLTRKSASADCWEQESNGQWKKFTP